MSSTTFSYAQAAKGHTIPQPSPQLTSSSAPPSVKDDVPTASTSVTAPSVASNEADARDSDKTRKAESEEPSAKQDLEVASFGGSGSSTASVTGQSVKTGQESDITMVEFQHLVEEKGSRSTSRTSQGPDGGKKGRKGRKGRANDKDAQSEQNQEDEKEDIPKPVLSEAPLPVVNYWTKRLEAQSAAKAKHAPVAPANGLSNPVSAGQEAKKRQAQEAGAANGEHVNGTKDNSHKKSFELSQGADHGPRRSAPRGSRAHDKDDKSIPALPSVADALFWPDPKSAATTTEEGVRKVQEKTDAAEKDGQEESGTNKRKNWVNLDIVPTVVFNTPLPTRGGTKTRGGARGGRESGSARGGHGAAPSSSSSGPGTDRPTAASGSAGPKAAATRPREGSIQSRTTSQSQPAVPHVAKDAVSKDQRKPTNSSAAEQARESAPDTSAASNKRASSMRDIRTELGGSANFEPSNAVSRNTQDRANGNHQQYPVREGRSDRGRGNGYRARGGHNNGAGSHIQSSSFAVNGQQYGTYPSRHNSAAPSPPPYGGQFSMSFAQPHRGRGNKWPGLGQTAGRNVANGPSFAIKPAQATDFPVPQYGAFMYPPPPIDPLVPVVKAQVEYYLSVENLCKDHYLRQQMDSQGFVKFSTIAGFKRMRELVKDHDLIRVACTHSDTIDYGFGDDNIERLRMHDLWHSFVLPYEERSEDAQNEGPAVFTPWYQLPQHSYGGPVIHPGYPAPSSAGLYSGFPDDRMFQPVYANGAPYEHAMNGTGDLNGHHYGPESQLSAVVPEYSPPMSPLTLESMTNFTDAQVEKMMVVLGFDNNDSSSPCDVADGKVYLANDTVKNGANGACDSTDSPSPNDVIVSDGDAEASPQLKQLVRQPYNEIRRVALEKRGGASPGETPVPMRNLYQFWSQMLLKDFNSSVYTEFRELALDDIRRDVPARYGLKHLLEFYRKLLLDTDGQKPWPQGRAIPGIFQLHFQEALEFDRTIGSRPDATI